jgi:1-acyl-sn-glycerol-3-phosphate acyltransferase
MIYHLLARYFRIALNVFYRRIEIEGREHLPADGPVLLIGNHSNGLVDPLVVAYGAGRIVSFTAKSTLFGMPILGSVLRASHVIGLHRAQDVDLGANPLRNKNGLAAIHARLAEGGAVLLFPEGQSHSDPAMRPFKRGAAKVVLDYLAADDPGGLRIVPFGLVYGDKDVFRSRVLLRFGPAIDAAAWLEAQPRATRRDLTQALRAAVEALTLDFASEEDARLAAFAAEVVDSRGAPPAMLGQPEPPLAARVTLVQRVRAAYIALGKEGTDPRALSPIVTRLAAYRDRLLGLGIAPREVFISLHPVRAAFFVLRELELFLVGMPLALWGLLAHLLPATITAAIAKRMTKEDDQFASNAIFIAFLVFPPAYLIALGLAWLWLPPFWAAAFRAATDSRWAAIGEAARAAKESYLEASAHAPKWELGNQTGLAPGSPLNGSTPTSSEGDSLIGLPFSPGSAEGEVFIVRSPEDFARFPRGAVLVARTTNPTWTPLFYRAAAVLTESGGPLSHGAVTAREMGIPAVMSLRDVMARLAQGDRVRVDGAAGRVVRVG